MQWHLFIYQKSKFPTIYNCQQVCHSRKQVVDANAPVNDLEACTESMSTWDAQLHFITCQLAVSNGISREFFEYCGKKIATPKTTVSNKDLNKHRLCYSVQLEVCISYHFDHLLYKYLANGSGI